MRISDWSSDVCSSDLVISAPVPQTPPSAAPPAYPFILFLTENVGAFEAYGLEASLDGQFEQGWKWALNYTWTKAKQHIKGNTGSQFEWPLAQIGRASGREECVSTCRSRWSPYH